MFITAWLKKKRSNLLQWRKVQTSAWLKCFSELWINKCPKASSDIKKSHDEVLWKQLHQVIAAEDVSRSYWILGGIKSCANFLHQSLRAGAALILAHLCIPTNKLQHQKFPVSPTIRPGLWLFTFKIHFLTYSCILYILLGHLIWVTESKMKA